MYPGITYHSSDNVPQNIRNWVLDHIDDQPFYMSGYPYKFGVFSDIHLCQRTPLQGNHSSYLNGYDDFVQALRKSRQNGIKFLCITGDLGMSGMPTQSASTSDRIVERNFYSGVLYDSDLEKRFNVLPCRGNHDGPLTEQQWIDKTGRRTYYYVKYRHEIFIFISLKETPSTTYGSNTEPYPVEAIQFLENTIKKNAGRRIFVFMHYPFNSLTSEYQYPGMADYNSSSGLKDSSRRNNGLFHSGYLTTYSNGKWDNLQCRQILEILSSYKSGHIFVFTGHNHFRFEVDQDYQNVIHYALTDWCDLFHVPSLNAPRDMWSQTVQESDYTKQPVQGYNITVTQNSVIVNGYEFQLCEDTKHGDIIRTYQIDSEIKIEEDVDLVLKNYLNDNTDDNTIEDILGTVDDDLTIMDYEDLINTKLDAKIVSDVVMNSSEDLTLAEAIGSDDDNETIDSLT